MNVRDQIRAAEMRIREEEERSQRASAIFHAQKTKAMSPIVKALDQIRREGYQVRAEDGSMQPFDFKYVPGTTQIEFTVFLPVSTPGGMPEARRYILTINYEYDDGLYKLSLKTPNGWWAGGRESPSANVCIECLMELAVKHQFLFHR
jgi:hypothetical protein